MPLTRSQTKKGMNEEEENPYPPDVKTDRLRYNNTSEYLEVMRKNEDLEDAMEDQEWDFSDSDEIGKDGLRSRKAESRNEPPNCDKISWKFHPKRRKIDGFRPESMKSFCDTLFQSFKNNQGLCILIGVLIIFVVWSVLWFVVPYYTHSSPANEKMSLNYFEQKYSNVSNSLIPCLTAAQNNEGPCVAVILYSSHAEQISKTLALDFACLSSPEGNCKENYFLYDGSLESELQDDTLVEFVLKKLKEKKVFVVHGLQTIRGDNVKHFHSLCDVHCERADKKAIFIFTLMNKSDSKQVNVRQKVEESMEYWWGKELEYDTLHPLKTRMMDFAVYYQ